MSNPTYNSANLTREAGAKIEKCRLVKSVEGKVAKTGTVKVGLADRAEDGDLLRVHLFHPAIFAG